MLRFALAAENNKKPRIARISRMSIRAKNEHEFHEFHECGVDIWANTESTELAENHRKNSCYSWDSCSENVHRRIREIRVIRG